MAFIKYEGASPSAKLQAELRTVLADCSGEDDAVDILRAFFHTGGTMNVACATMEDLIAESDTARVDLLHAIVRRLHAFPAYWENAPSQVDDLANGGAVPNLALQVELSESLQADPSAEAAYRTLCRFAESGGWMNVALATVESIPRFDDDAVSEAAETLRDWVPAVPTYRESAFFYDGAQVDEELRQELTAGMVVRSSGNTVHDILTRFAASGGPMNVALATLNCMREDGDEAYAERVMDLMDIVSGWCAAGKGIYEIALPIKVDVPAGFYRVHRHSVEDWFYEHGTPCYVDYLGYRFRDESDADKFCARWLSERAADDLA